jgi:endonuclease/exonuclease/phosphatase family metal-dependent hydrolase
MPYYKPLKYQTEDVRKRTVANLLDLRKQLDDELPRKKVSESLILGTWNIRNFDDNRFGYGPRLEESFYYLAEIIARFDVIAVQEICDDLSCLDKLMNVLGRNYHYILTDVTHRDLGGNDERLGFIYDSSKVNFRGIAGEIVLPPSMMISSAKGAMSQFARTPFGCSFQSGWFKFMFTTVHIYYGEESTNSEGYARRVEEIEKVAKYLSLEADNRDDNYILVGDFNITAPESRDYNALAKNGFQIIQNKLGSNHQQTKFYDQISFKSRRNELSIVQPERNDRSFQYFKSVYSLEKFESYKTLIKETLGKKLKQAELDLQKTTAARAQKKLKKQIDSLCDLLSSDSKLQEYYCEWRTFQMSDHLPLWVELKIDFSTEYLNYLSTYQPKSQDLFS